MAPSSVSRTSLRAFDLQAPTLPPFLLFTVTTQLSKAASPFLSSLPPGPSPPPPLGVLSRRATPVSCPLWSPAGTRPQSPHLGLHRALGLPGSPLSASWGRGASARAWVRCSLLIYSHLALLVFSAFRLWGRHGCAEFFFPFFLSYLLGRKFWKSGNSIHHCPCPGLLALPTSKREPLSGSEQVEQGGRAASAPGPARAPTSRPQHSPGKSPYC